MEFVICDCGEYNLARKRKECTKCESNLDGLDVLRTNEAFKLDDSITINLTTPIKRAIAKIAAQSGISASDIIRITLLHHLDDEYPGFVKVYVECVHEEIEAMKETKLRS
jgi:hypothetical protein